MNKRRRLFRQLGITRGDIVLAAVLLSLSLLLGLIMSVNQPEPEYVSIRIEGMEIRRLPLKQDCTYSIGDGNTIQISGGRVRMIYADCPDRICVRSGDISRSGQSIVCAPHRIVVTIIGEGSPDYDAITN